MTLRRLALVALIAPALASCSSSTGGRSSDAKASGTDTGASGGDASNGNSDTLGADGSDGTDAADGSDGTAASDGTDASDGTAVPECVTHADCSDAALPRCDTETGSCVAAPPGGLIGWGDGSTKSVQIDPVFTPPRAYQATDLAFHPTRDELWVTLRENPELGSCDEFTATQAGCEALEGSVAIITNPGGDVPTSVIIKDLNAWHFMRLPTGIAFSAGDTFATCSEARTGNYTDDVADFIGPSLWSADPDVFAQDPGPGLNGSHLDMLHQTPFCMGIAHVDANAYWTFNGNIGALDYYDFANDHGPGHDDHSDGILRRFANGELKRLPGVPSHLVADPSSGDVFISDTGNSRVVRIDTSSTKPGKAVPTYEAMAESREYTGAVVTTVIGAETLTQPSGIALEAGVLYVSDNATSQIHAVSNDGALLRSLDTGLPAGHVAGLEVQAALGRLYFTDLQTGVVRRIDPSAP